MARGASQDGPAIDVHPSIKILDTGLVYRNPRPHLEAVHAFHPSLSVVDEKELIATFDLGQGSESLDYRTMLSRSRNGGKTWELEGPLLPAAAPSSRRSTHSIRTALLEDGRMLGIGARFFRDDPEEGIVNRANLGLVPSELFLVWSSDKGRTWSKPEVVRPTSDSPGWEASHAPLDLGAGRIAIPLATWNSWDNSLPCGRQAGMILSEDGGKTWPHFIRTFDGRETGFIHWEQCVIPWNDGFLAEAWEYDPSTGQTRVPMFALGRGYPPVFGESHPADFSGETCELLGLGGDRVLAIYRGGEKTPGLIASIAHVQEKQWTTESQQPIWQGSASRMLGTGNFTEELSGLKFGSPSLKRCPDGIVLVAFWCQEEGLGCIRWFRLKIDL